MNKATDVMQVITGRAIQFVFTMTTGPAKTVTLDTYLRFPGRTYAQLESVAIAGMLASGYGAQHIERFTHYLVD